MKRINVNIHPASGYFFVESDGANIIAANWRGVIAKVIDYRKRNRLPPGNPKDEVHAQACTREPAHCQEDADPVYMQALKVASLKGRVLAWLASIRARQASGAVTFVDEALMRARASVCTRCPAHAAIAGGCGSCKRAVAEVRKEVLGGRPIDDRAAGCTALGTDCAVDAWLADPCVADPALPSCCWRRVS